MYLHLYTTLLLLAFGGWSSQLTSASRILALLINGHRSHLMVYASVINLLVDRGHDVTVVTTKEVLEFALAGDNLRWIRLSENYTNPLVTTEQNSFDKIETMMKRIEKTAEFMQDPNWQGFMQEKNQFDLMILGYLFNEYQLGVAAHFKCPVVIMWTGQPIGFIHSLMGNPEKRWYVPQPYDRHQFKGFQAIAFGWFEKFMEMLALYKMKESYDEHFPESQYPSFWDIRKNVSLALCNHHSLSEGPIAPFVPGIIEIGGIHYQRSEQNSSMDETINISNWLETQQNIIYFSFGSRVKWSQLQTDLEMTFIKAFKQFPNYTILWTYDKNCSQLQSYASNIKCKSWWPQSTLLASNKTQLFITHGGKGSLSEAYRYGKPILGLPLFGDQRANVARLQQRKFGLKLDIDKLDKQVLVENLHELLNNSAYKDNVARFSALYSDRPINSEDSVIYWLEYVIRHRGAKHLRSPALDLNVIEYYCLDFYMIVLFIILVSKVVCDWLEHKIVK